MEVYLLWHAHNLDEEEEVKLLGVYSSEQKAEKARERARSLPGFRDYPENFHIDRYAVDRDHWTEGFIPVRWGEDDQTPKEGNLQ
jgi:homoserine kinase type II